MQFTYADGSRTLINLFTENSRRQAHQIKVIKVLGVSSLVARCHLITLVKKGFTCLKQLKMRQGLCQCYTDLCDSMGAVFLLLNKHRVALVQELFTQFT